MVLEKNILPLMEWLITSVPIALAIALALVFLGLLIGFLVTVLRRGPGEAMRSLGGTIAGGVVDLANMSPRRLWAMTWLAVQEAVRRRVLVTFAVFVVVLLFASWFLDRRTDDPAQLYLWAVLNLSNFLVLLLAIFISTFSLPNDIKHHTVYTIVTKPVRIWEIVLGRMFGFTIVGTLLLAVMGLFSYVFVVRGLDHRHAIPLLADEEMAAEASPDQEVQPTADDPAVGRRTTSNHFHRHLVQRTPDGQLQTDMVQAHQHVILEQDGGYRFSPPVGNLLARVPVVSAPVRFKDRSGEDAPLGINVGNEWGYRSYIEGGTLAAAIFTFENVTEAQFPQDRFPQGLPLELTIRVFRTYKGIIDERIRGAIRLVNPNPNIAPDKRLQSTPFIFEPNEFYPKRENIPWKLKVERPDGTTDNADLMKELVHDGKLEVWITCQDRSQYFGVARNDVYLRAADRPFWANFAKSYISIWCQMFIVTCFGVMFSTVLSGPVAMLATCASLLLGYFSPFVAGLVRGDVEGGGPIEALIRILKQINLTIDMDIGTVPERIVRGFDVVFVHGMFGLTNALPNFGNFATTDFVASGFDIPPAYVTQHLIMAGAFFVMVTVAGYFLFKSREIAA